MMNNLDNTNCNIAVFRMNFPCAQRLTFDEKNSKI